MRYLVETQPLAEEQRVRGQDASCLHRRDRAAIAHDVEHHVEQFGVATHEAAFVARRTAEILDVSAVGSAGRVFPVEPVPEHSEAERRTLLVPAGQLTQQAVLCRSLPRQPNRCCNSGTSPWLCGPGRSALHVVEWKHGRSLPHSLLHMRTSQAQQCYLIGSSFQVPSPI